MDSMVIPVYWADGLLTTSKNCPDSDNVVGSRCFAQVIQTHGRFPLRFLIEAAKPQWMAHSHRCLQNWRRRSSLRHWSGRVAAAAQDVGDVFADLADHLRFNPESRFVNFILDRVSILDDRLLRRIGAVVFIYAGLDLVEGIGLYLEKVWPST